MSDGSRTKNADVEIINHFARGTGRGSGKCSRLGEIKPIDPVLADHRSQCGSRQKEGAEAGAGGPGTSWAGSPHLSDDAMTARC